MTPETLEQVVIGAAALGAITSVALVIYLGCLRLIVWDLVPASALAHIQWWQRHARMVLLITLGTTVVALLAWVIIQL
jgi:hypothetical protein